jgi:7-cyano-7-deazaguanine synthase
MSEKQIFNTAKAYGDVDAVAVLLSGGIDSTTAMYKARRDHPFAHLIAVGVDYGQRHLKELECATKLAAGIGASFFTLPLASIIPSKTMLRDGDQNLPKATYDDIKGVSPTYVPFRNGLMISAATSWFVGYLQDNFDDGYGHLYTGMHAEDAASFAYPDCTPEFAGSMQNAIWMGTYGKVRLITPFINSAKHEIVEVGSKLGVPYESTWSCYAGGEFHCGECPTCHARRDAFIKAGAYDGTVYASGAQQPAA